MRNLNDVDWVTPFGFIRWIPSDYGAKGNSKGGAFEVPFNGDNLRVIASNGRGWDHVSVSLANRTPTWEEMEYVKRLFFKKNEVAFQLHVAEEDHISVHPYCLHIWRSHNRAVPTPPKGFV